MKNPCRTHNTVASTAAPTLLALREEYIEARRKRMMEKERQRREMERLRRIETDEKQRVRSQSGIIDDGIEDDDDSDKKKETEEDEYNAMRWRQRTTIM